jgi:hypothetical protein
MVHLLIHEHISSSCPLESYTRGKYFARKNAYFLNTGVKIQQSSPATRHFPWRNYPPGDYVLVEDSVFLIDFTFAARPSGSLKHSGQRTQIEAGTANE